MNFWEDFSEEKRAGIRRAIEVAEMNTSGEIRVHLENKCKEDVFDRAAYIFEKLNMHKTKLRNGILFYMAVSDRKFVIMGDAGINQKVPEDFWDNIKEKMIGYFKDDKIAEGLTEGIYLAGEQLKVHFPHQRDDVNELPDDISYGDLGE